MKVVVVTFQMLLLLLFESGCNSVPAADGPPAKADNGLNKLSIYTSYSPVKIDIIPLTEFSRLSDAGEGPEINVYVSLLDSFGCQVKSPGVFRFELYERVPRSADPKGKRTVIWPDIDLTEPVDNNNYWRDFFRAYKFNLDFEPQSNQSYILQVTYQSPSSRRLSDEFVLKHTKWHIR